MAFGFRCSDFVFMLVSYGFCCGTFGRYDDLVLAYGKVWMEHGELCVRGTFYNRRSDLTVTKLDEMILQITFTGTDGKTFQFIGHPKRLPMLKLPANGSKKVTFNFGPFSGEWKDWATKEDYSFSYINGSRW